MTFLLDHDVPIEATRLLHREGHTAIRVVECLQVITPDPAVFAHAKAQGWLTTPATGETFSRSPERGRTQG